MVLAAFQNRGSPRTIRETDRHTQRDRQTGTETDRYTERDRDTVTETETRRQRQRENYIRRLDS